MTDVQTQPDATTDCHGRRVRKRAARPADATGTIVQITGPVVDVEFPADSCRRSTTRSR